MISIEAATDVTVVQALLEPYIAESVYRGLTYNPENARQILLGYLRTSAWLVLNDGEPVGFASMALGRTFYDEIEADVQMFYVRPDMRGTGAARALVQQLMWAAEQGGASIIYSACFSGIDERNDTLWANLWRKYGFQKLGTVMVRSKK